MENKPPANWKKKPLNYLQYSGIAFQIIGIMLLGVFGGKKLDNYFQTSSPYFTLALSILAVFMSLYFIIKEVIKKKC